MYYPITITIKQLVSERSGLNYRFFLPALQRQFVWLDNPKEEKIETLFDSLLKGYPIGSFLLWQVQRDDLEGQRIEKFTREYKESNPFNEVVTERYANDEKRLTALYIGLTGSITIIRKSSPIQKRLYINLEKKIDSQTEQPKYILSFFSDKEIAERKEKGEFWFKCSDILTTKNTDISSKYAENKDAQNILFNFLDFVNSSITMPCYEFDKDKAVEVFTRINSQGERLDKTDLLLSFIITFFTKKDIKEDIQTLVSNWKEKGFAQIDSEAFLTICMILQGEKAKFKVSDFSKPIVNLIENEWERIQRSINHVVKRLTNLGYAESNLSLNIIYCLVVASYKKLLNEKDVDDPTLLDFVQRLQLVSFFGEGTTGKLQTIIENMKGINSFFEFKEKIKDKLEVSTIEDIIERADYTKSSVALAVLQVLFGNRNRKDQIDHIYPHELLKKRKEKDYKRAHELFNLQFLEDHANQRKGEEEPQKWLDKQYGIGTEEQKKFKELHTFL